MEKKSVFNKIILILCFIALLINAVETNQIRLQTKLQAQETLLQKFMYKFPVDVKFAQKVINENNLEFTIKDKNIAEKISAPFAKVSYNILGESYRENRYYSAKDENNRLVYVSLNVKSLYNKKADFDDLVKTKIIYADKYEFDCFSIKTTKDKTDFTSSISLMPLQSQDVYLVAEMPKDFVNTKNSLVLEMFIDNTKYTVKLR